MDDRLNNSSSSSSPDIPPPSQPPALFGANARSPIRHQRNLTPANLATYALAGGAAPHVGIPPPNANRMHSWERATASASASNTPTLGSPVQRHRQPDDPPESLALWQQGSSSASAARARPLSARTSRSQLTAENPVQQTVQPTVPDVARGKLYPNSRSRDSYTTLRRKTMRRTSMFTLFDQQGGEGSLGIMPVGVPPPESDLVDDIIPPPDIPPPPVGTSSTSSIAPPSLPANINLIPAVCASSLTASCPPVMDANSGLYDLCNLDARYENDVNKLESALRLPTLNEDIEVRWMTMPTDLANPHLSPEERKRDVKEERVAQYTADVYYRDIVAIDHKFSSFAGTKKQAVADMDNDFFSPRKSDDEMIVKDLRPNDNDLSGSTSGSVSGSGASLGSSGSTSSSGGGRRSSMLLSSSLSPSEVVQPVRSSDEALQKGLQDLRWGNDLFILKLKFVKDPAYYEPLFFTGALYDCKRKQKMTEDAYFHANPDGLLTQVGMGCLSTNPVGAMQFGIDLPSAGHVIVIKAYRVFRGEAEKDLQLLAKNKVDVVPARKDVKEWANKCQTMPALQPFMWTAFTLFTESDGGLVPRMIQDSDLTMMPVKGVLTDENIYDAYNNDLEKTKKTKGMRPFVSLYLLHGDKKRNGAFRDNAEFTRYDPSFSRMLPDTGGKQNVKVLQSFESYPKPYTEHINNLYIYPDSLTIKHCTPSNLQVSVRLVSATQLLYSKIVPYECGYPHLFNINEQTMTPDFSRCKFEKEVFSSVQWGEKRPQFADEMKLALPMHVRECTLLFTFYNLICPGKRIEVGYAAIKLQRDSTVLRDGVYHLCVYATLADLISGDFSKPLSESDYKKVKYVFSFRSRSMSSIYPQDVRVGHLLSEVYLSTEERIDLSQKQRALKGLREADPVECSHFLFPILDALLQALSRWGPESSADVFNTLTTMLMRIHAVPAFRNTDNGNFILLAWVDILFDPTRYKHAEKDISELFLSAWLEDLRSGGSSEYSWLFLRLISKAATVYAVQQSKTMNLKVPKQIVPRQFQSNLCELVEILLSLFTREMKEFSGTEKRLRPVNIEYLAEFINSLYLFVNRGTLLERIIRFFHNTDPKNADQEVSMILKFPLLKKFVEYEHYIPMNDPVPVDVRSIDGPLNKIFWTRYPLVGLFQEEICSGIQSDAGVRVQALGLLRSILRKHNSDKRYQDPTVRQRIATMYFPLVYTILQENFKMTHLDLNQQHDLLACVIWILTYCSPEVLSAWWNKDTARGYKAFFDLVSHCVDIFHDQSQLQDAINTSCLLAQRFVKEHKSAINTPKCPAFQKMYDAVNASFEECSASTIDTVVEAVRTLVVEVPEQFFEFPGNSLIDTTSYNIFKAWTELELSEKQRRRLVDLFFLMVTTEFSLTKDTKRVRAQTVLAASRLVGDDVCDPKSILSFFSRLDELVQRGENVSGDLELFRSSVKDLVAKVKPLFSYHDAASQNDPDSIIDRYYETALSQDENPDQRIAWLLNLAGLQAQNQHWEEAAQCNIFVAVLISKYLAEVCHNQLSLSDFRSLNPNLGRELTHFDLSSAMKNGVLQSDVWSFESLIGFLTEANNYLSNGRHYEQCIEVLSLLSAIYKRERDYARLNESLMQTQQMCQAMVKEKERDSKVFALYYRVAFYGNRAERLKDREFIYKRPPTCVLSVIQQEIMEYAASKVDGRKDMVELLPNREVDRKSLSPNKIYYQISSVNPIQDTSSLAASTIQSFEAPLPTSSVFSSNKSFDRHFGAHTFVFAQAYSKNGNKAHTDDLRDQGKKKTIFETEIAFPFVKNRLEVVSRREVILEPIEHAIETIVERCDKIKEQLQNNPPRLNPLQQVLQGSVAPMVNEGPLKLCETFLSAEAKASAKPEHVDLLTLAMCNFVELCAAAIQLDQMLIGPQHRKFHSMIEKYYEDLCKKSEVYFVGFRRKPKTSFTADDLDRKVWREQPRVSLNS